MSLDIAEVVQKVQYMIAPAVMVSSSALLLLGFHNKFSNLANRFRVLNHEKRALQQKTGRDTLEDARLANLVQQIEQLMIRASYVKNAILSTYLAIICFLGTSILISLHIYVSFPLRAGIAVMVLAGFLALIVTSIYMVLETWLFFNIMKLEKRL